MCNARSWSRRQTAPHWHLWRWLALPKHRSQAGETESALPIKGMSDALSLSFTHTNTHTHTHTHTHTRTHLHTHTHTHAPTTALSSFASVDGKTIGGWKLLDPVWFLSVKFTSSHHTHPLTHAHTHTHKHTYTHTHMPFR